MVEVYVGIGLGLGLELGLDLDLELRSVCLEFRSWVMISVEVTL